MNKQKNKLTDEEDEIVTRLIKEDLPVREIAERAGVGQNAVRKRKLEHFGKSETEISRAFKHDKGNKYCYDEAIDCKYYRIHNCTLVKDTRFIDEYGLRDICPFYTNRYHKYRKWVEK